MIRVIQTRNQCPGQHLRMQRKLHIWILSHLRIGTALRKKKHTAVQAGSFHSQERDLRVLSPEFGRSLRSTLPGLVMLIKPIIGPTGSRQCFQERIGLWEGKCWLCYIRDHKLLECLLREAFLSHIMISHLIIFSPTQYLYFPLRERLRSVFSARAINI